MLNYICLVYFVEEGKGVCNSKYIISSMFTVLYSLQVLSHVIWFYPLNSPVRSVILSPCLQLRKPRVSYSFTVKWFV